MTRLGYTPYEPQLVPVEWAENIWTVEGPEVAYRLAGMAIPCPTRMTVAKLADGGLWLHSPVAYTAALDQALAKLGRVSALIAPNSYHYLNVKPWAEAHRESAVFASPDVVQKIDLARCIALVTDTSPKRATEIEQVSIDLGSFKETVFFHRASRTLIVTDLMQTFEESRIRSLPIKLLLKAGGATGPNARPSIEIRLAARSHREALRAGVERMIEWNPERIILSHGRCVQTNAVAEIERAFRWVA
ncbi:DUF4336 domain-containing protein [Sphingomonas radiodurans]|uniref:DUF4336 domain-containing protein n=1 Tax=Sphingomonas radiodurans TaxID=2890321 RepID=UPI001E63848C|nr:DUF4336 domain-containing protein [Sphingomonas radiodurans]WBH16259.1 DUF4336 domain-containing protein [Sphingomonas radiodurans]